MAAEELAGRIGQTAEACEALGVARSTLYRRRQPVTPKPKRRPRPHRALDETEREEVLGALHCERFVDKAPAQVWATLLDEGTYLCSIRTMYRILEEHGEVRERRNQRRHPNYTKPELLAEAPNQVWSWDVRERRRSPENRGRVRSFAEARVRFSLICRRGRALFVPEGDEWVHVRGPPSGNQHGRERDEAQEERRLRRRSRPRTQLR